jgi:predicted nucleotidyltransferase
MAEPYVDPEREAAYARELEAEVRRLTADLGCTVVLFGSRARGTIRRSSDFDLGVRGLSEAEFRRLKRNIETYVEASDIPHGVDVVDLDRADRAFNELALRGAVTWKNA